MSKIKDQHDSARLNTVVEYLLHRAQEDGYAIAHYTGSSSVWCRQLYDKLKERTRVSTVVAVNETSALVAYPPSTAVPSGIAQGIIQAANAGKATLNLQECLDYFPQTVWPHLWIQALFGDRPMAIDIEYGTIHITLLDIFVPPVVDPASFVVPDSDVVEELSTKMLATFHREGIAVIAAKTVRNMIADAGGYMPETQPLIQPEHNWLASLANRQLYPDWVTIGTGDHVYLILLHGDRSAFLQALNKYVDSTIKSKRRVAVPGAEYTHHSGNKYRCVALANMDVPPRKGFEPTVVYERRIDGDMHTYTRPMHEFLSKFTGPYKEMS